MSLEIIEIYAQELLPPAMLGTAALEVLNRVESFYLSVAEIFER